MRCWNSFLMTLLRILWTILQNRFWNPIFSHFFCHRTVSQPRPKQARLCWERHLGPDKETKWCGTRFSRQICQFTTVENTFRTTFPNPTSCGKLPSNPRPEHDTPHPPPGVHCSHGQRPYRHLLWLGLKIVLLPLQFLALSRCRYSIVVGRCIDVMMPANLEYRSHPGIHRRMIFTYLSDIRGELWQNVHLPQVGDYIECWHSAEDQNNHDYDTHDCYSIT